MLVTVPKYNVDIVEWVKKERPHWVEQAEKSVRACRIWRDASPIERIDIELSKLRRAQAVGFECASEIRALMAERAALV